MKGMKHLRTLGMALVAALALAAVAASAASASQPEYLKCAKAAKVEGKYTGGFNNKLCTEVNGTGEGKYATSALTTPLAYTGKSKTTTLYYSKPGGPIVWELICKKSVEGAEISEATSEEGLITLESCSLANEITKAKAVKCAGTMAVPFAGLLREQTVPASPHAGITYAFFMPAYSCAGVSIETTTALPFVTGEVSPSAKGEFGSFTVNKTTGAQNIEQWVEEGKPTTWAPLEAEVTAEAKSESLRVGIEMLEPLAPKKEVVIH
jgi:hypothetical protein